MKTLASLMGGAVVLTEEAGKVTLSFDESLGGGAAAGIIKGQGSVVLDGAAGLALGEKLLNAHLPAAMQPLAPVVEGIFNQAIAALE